MNIKLINFSGSAFCKYRLYNCKDAFPMFSAELHTGTVYHFISDFSCGSWAAVSCIGGKGGIDVKSKIMIDNRIVAQKEMSAFTGWIAEKRTTYTYLLKSPRKLIGRALKNSGIDKSPEEIKELFALTDGRFDRPLNQSSGEIFNISMALQYAKGKKIICFPWISEFEMNKIEGLWNQIEFMKSSDAMILIPSSGGSFLDSVCDGYIRFRKNGITVMC